VREEELPWYLTEVIRRFRKEFRPDEKSDERIIRAIPSSLMR